MLENNNVVNSLENEVNVESIEAVAYVRSAGSHDWNNHIESQKNAIQKYADENNIRIVEWYIDDGYSGVTDERPAFQRMFNDLNHEGFNQHKDVKLVLVKKADIFARNLEVFIRYSVKMKLCDVDLRIINTDYFNVAESNFLQQILATISDYYKKDSEFNKNEGVQL